MNSWKVLGTVMGKVSVDLPSFAPVKGLLDVHGGRSEGLEGDDDVGDMELGLKVQLYGDCLIAIGGLPPGHALLSPGGHWRIPPVDDVRHIVSQVLEIYFVENTRQSIFGSDCLILMRKSRLQRDCSS